MEAAKGRRSSVGFVRFERPPVASFGNYRLGFTANLFVRHEPPYSAGLATTRVFFLLPSEPRIITRTTSHERTLLNVVKSGTADQRCLAQINAE